MTEINHAPNLSILLPTYNRERYLSQCFDSLLRQNCDSYELYVRDNASDDNTANVVEDYRPKFEHLGVKLVYKVNVENVGFRDNMVDGLKELSRDYAFILMDDDFILEETGLWNLYHAIDDNNDVVMSTSRCMAFKDDTEDGDIEIPFQTTQEYFSYKYVSGKNYFLNVLSSHPTIILSSVIFDRQLILASSWEAWSQRAALDVNLYHILALEGDIAVFDSPLAAYRFHSNQDYNSFPIEDSMESHSRIMDWYRLAQSKQAFDSGQLRLWWIKTLLLKDQGVFVQLFKREPQELQRFLQWLRNYNPRHYFIIVNFMPCMVRYYRELWLQRLPMISGAVNIYFDIKRFLLRLFLHRFRKKFDEHYCKSLGHALRGL